MIAGISHLLMWVNNFDASREMYGEGLGLKEVAAGIGGDGHRVAIFAAGAAALELHEDKTARPALDPETGEPMRAIKTPSIWISHIAFHVRDADVAYDLLGRKGIPFIRSPQDQPVGHHLIRRRLLEFDDPDLFTVQLAQLIDNEGRSAEPAGAIPGEPSGVPQICDKLDHINLRVRNMPAKRAFYREMLGLSEIFHKPTAWGEESMFLVGETVVELDWQPETPTLQGGTVGGIAFSTGDLGQVYQMLRDQGVTVSAPAAQSPLPGIQRRYIAFQDPDGLPLQVVQTRPG
ncbi:MAG: VOC family protein [Chloroflexi bacterium]|nr:VOC family protein [Chloroflexota bacterium]